MRSARFWVWTAPALLWAAFTFWYTNTAGAFTEDEVTTVMAQLQAEGATSQTVERMRRFMLEDDGGQFLMVNLIDLADGGQPKLDHYMEHMLPAMLKRASHPVLLGGTVNQAMDLLGIDGAENWTSAAVVRYRSRRDILEIATNPVFAERHDSKLAALTKTIAVPIEPGVYLSDPRLLLFLGLLALAGVVNAVVGGRKD